jgi:hypothetical protein
MAEDVEAHLIKLELQLQGATRKDAAAMTDLISKDFREFGASGHTWTRDEIIAELLAEVPYVIKSENFLCQRLGDNLELLTYVCKAAKRTTLRSSIWRREGSFWRIIFHQGTIVSPEN